MPFQVSPGVNVSEIDLTNVVVGASTSAGGFAGNFAWGPIEDVQLITDEDTLVATFQKPTDDNYEDFFTAANFLSYSGAMNVVRAANTTLDNAAAPKNASANTSAYANIQIKNSDDYYNNHESGSANYGPFVAKYAGELGNSLKISICGADRPTTDLTGTVAYTHSGTTIAGTDTVFTKELRVGDVISIAGSTPGALFLITDITSDTAATVASQGETTDVTTATANRKIQSAYEQPSSVMFGTVAISATSTTVTGTATKFQTQLSVGDILIVAGQSKKITAITDDTTLTVESKFIENKTGQSYAREWEYASSFSQGAPGTSAFAEEKGVSLDEIHVAIVDEDGLWTGTQNTVIEVHPSLSVASNAKSASGGDLYYVNYLNKNSKYVWWQDHPSINSVDTAGSTGLVQSNFIAWGASTSTTSPTGEFYQGGLQLSLSFNGGTDGSAPTTADVQRAYDLFRSAEDVDIAFLMAGAHGSTVVRYLVDQIAETRKDCLVFFSPEKADVVDVSSSSDATENVVDYRKNSVVLSSSYAVMDSGWKYQFDKYNDKFRYVPLNADIAGACARTDDERDPFFSPAGFVRGQIKGVVKLPFNPKKAERDKLYSAQVNPVVSFPGEGVVLFGDKTLLARNSAFDRINVRRLFILLEKSIAVAAKSQLFEFNDEFTRSQFVSIVEPFLRDIQGRGGIQDFAVVCDATNNTPEVVDRNEFRGDIYVKPSRAINFIQLNFVAVRSGVEFAEIVGNV